MRQNKELQLNLCNKIQWMKRPFVLFPLLTLHVSLGLSALYGGWKLLTDAAGLGVNPEWLAGSPFKTFAVPGLVLFVLNGLFPLFIAWGLLLKPNWPAAGILNIYRDRHWSWTYSLFSGLVLLIWITVQLTMVPSFWLQPFFLGVGWLIVVFTLWPGVMQYYLEDEQAHQFVSKQRHQGAEF